MSCKDLINKCGDPNPVGVKVKTYYVSIDDIDVFPPFKTTTAQGDSVVLDGNITLLPLKAWNRVDINSKTGEIKDTMVGPLGSRDWESTFDAITPKADPAQVEFFSCLANGCFVVLVEDKAGNFRVLGNPDLPASAETIEITTGKASGDNRGTTYQIKAEVGTPAPFYEGTIDLDPLT